MLIRKNRLNPVALSVVATMAVLSSAGARAQDGATAGAEQNQAAGSEHREPQKTPDKAKPAQAAGTGASGSQDTTGAALQVPVVTVTAHALPGELPGAYAGGQVAKGAALGLLGETDIHDIPFNVTSYTSQTIQDQQAHNLADVVQNNPSVRMDDPAGSISDDFTIRGFIVPSDDVALNGVYGIAPKWRVPTEMLERVEVITGPTAMLTGATPEGSVGGGINVVTKRATDKPVTSITESYQSDSQFQTHVDVGRRFGDNNQFGIRVNGLYSNGNTNVGSQSDRRGAGSIALDYRGERLRASLDFIRQVDDLKAPNRWMTFATPIIPAAPSSSTNFSPNGYALERGSSLLGHVEYDVTDNTTVYASIGGQRLSGDELVANPYGALPSGDFTNAYFYRKGSTSVDTAEVGMRSQFDTGPVHHNLAVTASAFRDRVWLGISGGSQVTSNLYDVVSPPYPATQVGDPGPLSKTTLESVGLADTLGLFQNRLLVTLGARYQQVGVTNYDNPSTWNTASNTNKGAATPMAAVLYKLTPSLSVYGNYVEGLNLGTVAPDGAANAGQAFGPAKARQYEVGAKWDLGRFTTTLSLFQITEPGGTLNPDTNVYSIAGDERHRGVEWSVFGEVARGIRLLGGASYTQGILTSTGGGVDQGNEAPGVPRFLVNIGAEWDLPWLPGVTLTGRGIFTGPQYVDAANTQKLASWTIFDVGARYRTTIAHRSVTLRASVNNVFNRDYWAGVYSGGGWAYLSSPRTVRVSATVDF